MSGVRMRTLSASPAGVFAPGQVRECDGKAAKALVDRGYAEPVRERAPPKPAAEAPSPPEVETAEADPREENAAQATGKRGPKKGG